MTPQQIADQKAYHRAALERLDALEKAQRPALTAGQVWRGPEWGSSIICAWDGTSGSVYNIERQSLVHYANGLADCFVFVGLARDVLRVVQPDAVEQVAPSLPFVLTEGFAIISSLEAGEGDEYSEDGKIWWKSGGGTCHPKIPAMYYWRRKVAPVQDEPTGAELVGKTCLVNDGGETWYGPYPITHWAQYPYTANGALWRNAKLYREGVTP